MLALASLIAYVFVVRYIFITDLAQSWWNGLAWSAVFTAAFLVFLYLAMHYLEMLSFISKKWSNLKHAIVGVAALSAATNYEFDVIAADFLLSLLGISMFAFMFLFGSRAREFLVMRFPLPEHERQKIVSIYPPQRYSDLYAFHAVIVLAALMPVIVKYLHLSIRQA